LQNTLNDVYLQNKHTPQDKNSNFFKSLNNMEKMINTLGMQANELLKNQVVVDMLNACANESDKCLMLAIASMHALAKANS
jgi:hypothetical protein